MCSLCETELKTIQPCNKLDEEQSLNFSRKYKEKQFCSGHILTQGVFVAQLCSDVGISVRRIV
jgi:hypothetical protein